MFHGIDPRSPIPLYVQIAERVRLAIATGTLGLYWGAVYLRRRSFVGPMVSHAGFNLIELLQYFTIGR